MIKFTNTLKRWDFERTLSRIFDNEIALSSLSDQELRNKYQGLKQTNIDQALILVYAIVKETFKRTIGIIPYDEQILCGIAMHKGYVAEMKTGEGKTIAAVFPAVLNALKGQVHVVTVNDYLAERDYKNTLPIYELLGIKCSVNNDTGDKTKTYDSDIIYTSSSELIFDYLRDELNYFPKRFFNKLNMAILDEIDFVLLDNANSNFSVSRGGIASPSKIISVYYTAGNLFRQFKGGEVTNKLFVALDDTQFKDLDYIYYRFNNTISLTQKGISKVEQYFGIKSLLDYPIIYKAVLHTVEAYVSFKKGVDYVIRDNRLCLINRVNGRIMPNTSKEKGLQQAIEIKESLLVSGENILENTMSYQVFFSKYNKLTGMSGTVQDAGIELQDLFNLETFLVPTHTQCKRMDFQDKVFKTTKEKYAYMLKLVKGVHPKQPVLLICDSEQETDHIYNKLLDLNLNPQLLVSNTSSQEEQLIKDAGKAGTITVTTNMASRGTDIILDNEALKNGGLFVLCLNRYESLRIDNQIRGRAGRQGQPGGCIFLSALEDGIWSNMEKTKFMKLYNLPSEKFYSPRQQQKTLKLLKVIQESLDEKMYYFRKLNFYLDTIIDHYKKYILNYEIVLENNALDYLLSILKMETTQLMKDKPIKPLLFFGEKIKAPTTNSNINDMQGKIAESIKNKFQGLGFDTSVTLLKAIIDNVTRESWQDVRQELINLKADIGLRGGDSNILVSEYLKESDKILKNFLRYLNVRTLECFLNAEIKSVENKEVS